MTWMSFEENFTLRGNIEKLSEKTSNENDKTAIQNTITDSRMLKINS